MQNLVHTECPYHQSKGVGLDGLTGPFQPLVFSSSVKFPDLNGDPASFLIPGSHSPRVTAVNLPALFPIIWQDYRGCRAEVSYTFKLWVGFPRQDFDVSVTRLLVTEKLEDPKTPEPLWKLMYLGKSTLLSDRWLFSHLRENWATGGLSGQIPKTISYMGKSWNGSFSLQ